MRQLWIRQAHHKLTDIILTAALLIVALLLAADLIARSAPVQAASEESPICEKAGTAEGQTLYLCDVGVLCAWDPSPTLGAGVLDCDW